MPFPPLAAFADDPALDGDVRLLRRLAPDWVERDSDGSPHIKSAAFQMQTASKAADMGYPGPCMSLGLESVVNAHGGMDAFLGGSLSEYGVARLSASEARAAGFFLQAVPEADQPWHVAAFGPSGSQAKRAKSLLARAAELVVAPGG